MLWRRFAWSQNRTSKPARIDKDNTVRIGFGEHKEPAIATNVDRLAVQSAGQVHAGIVLHHFCGTSFTCRSQPTACA